MVDERADERAGERADEVAAPCTGSPVSLRLRLLLVSLAVLLAFVGLTGVALDRAFRDSADTAQQARLEALLYLLMGTLEVAGDGSLVMPASLPEPRLALPGSGLYAVIARPDESSAGQSAVRWQSPSTLGVRLALDDVLAPGERVNTVRSAADGQPYRVVAQGVRWAIGETPFPLSFNVAAPLASLEAEVASYRRSLWGALAVVSALLLLALVVVLEWALQPLRRLARRLAAMEAGEVGELGGAYPRELAPLANNLDRLLERERALMARHRQALGDLAHSLKTPLAVLRGAPPDADLPALVQAQAQRMDEIVGYQLQRAATAGASRFAAPLPLAGVVERVRASLAKVHAGRQLALLSAVPAGLAVRIDEGDALELLGNLMDNACKWAAGRVEVSAVSAEGGVRLVVEDDGPGIDDPQGLLVRGVRGDERTAGHGIGLAIVADIVLAYGGSLHFGRSAAGGARVEVWLPQR
jgi:two-component system, OmpR family, sensor histidine kinase PhoQ